MHRNASYDAHLTSIPRIAARRASRPAGTVFSRRSILLASPLAVVLLAVAILALGPAAADAQTLTWDASGSHPTSPTDGSGTWSTGNADWSNGSGDVSWISGDNAIIGDGGTLTATTDQITLGTGGVTIGNLTFGALNSSDTLGYNIVDTSGAGTSSLILANTGATPTALIDNTAYNVVTNIDANLAAASAFTLNVSGTGSLGVGGSIGTTNAAGSLNVNLSPTSGHTPSLTLSGVNQLSSTTITSGTVNVTNNGSLGSGAVSLAGGTLNLFQGSISTNVATSLTATTYDSVSAGNYAGVYSVANWNNFEYGRTSKIVTPLGTEMADNAGILTSASVSAIVPGSANATYSIAGGALPTGLTGTQQLFYSWLFATGGTPASVSIQNVPYANYSVYVYYWSNAANVIGTMGISTGPNSSSLTANPTTYYFSTGGGTEPNSYLLGSTTSGTNTVGADYAVWSGVSGNTVKVTDTFTGTGSNDPGIAGIQIVAAPISLTQNVAVTASSTIDIGAYVTAPMLAGNGPGTYALTIANGSTLSVQNPSGFNPNGGSASDLLNVTGATSITNSPGTFSIGAGTALQLAGITDNGLGFNTSGAGAVILTADSSATASGPVSLGGPTQLSTSTATGTASATGTGALTIASGGTLTVPTGAGFTGLGIVSPSSTNVAVGGSIVGPASGGTLNINSPVVTAGPITGGAGALQIGGTLRVNSGGTVTTGAGTLTILGATTVASGGGLFLGLSGTGSGQTAQTLTTGGLTLAGGGTSTFTLNDISGSSTGISGLISTTSLAVTGSHTIDAYFTNGAIPITPGAVSYYDLINYTGSQLATTQLAGGGLSFGAGESLVIGPGASGTAPTGTIPVSTSFGLQLNNVANPNGGYEIQLQVTAPILSWTGATSNGNTNGANWDIGTQNWALGAYPNATASAYADGNSVTFYDNSTLTNSAVTNYNITITPATVSPASLDFLNNSTNYTFSGGAIGGPALIALNGAATVTLANSNSFTGPVAINSGELILQNSGALGSTSGVTVASGGALALQGGFSFGNRPLSLNGAGVASNPAGALDNISGSNSYAGAITLAGPATINTTNSADTLTLSGGIIGGANLLTFTGAGNTTISGGAISGSGGLAYNASGTLTLASANSALSGPITVGSGGTIRVQNSGALGASSGVTVSSGSLDLQGGVTIGAALNIAGAGASGSPAGVLNSSGGANYYTGAITLTNAATIGSSSTTPGDGLTISGGLNTTAGNYGLTFTGAGNASVLATAGRGGISGGGSVTKNGAGNVVLGSANSYTGGTIINQGILSVSGGASAALGTGNVNLAGGTLQFQQAGTIGVDVSTSDTGGTYYSIAPTSTAGVVPANNWNLLQILRFTASAGPFSNTSSYSNSGITSASANTPTPFTLVNSAGQTTTAQVTAWKAQDTYDVVYSPQPTNPNAQIINGYLDSNPGKVSASLTVGSIPYSNYSVIVYFNNNSTYDPNSNPPAALATGSVSLTSAGYTSPTYQYTVLGEGSFPGYEQVTSTGTPQSGNYAEFTGLTSSSFTVNSEYIESVEIVNNGGFSVGNSVSVSSNSTIDLTGTSSASMGNLSIGNNTLSVTGGSTGANVPFTLSLGSTTLTGNATFNVANNGSGTGTLNLGAIGDGTSSYGVSLTGPGTVRFTSPTGSTYHGGTIVTAGTLRLVDMGANSSASATGSGTVTVGNGSANSGTLAGPANVGGNAYISGATTIASGGTLSATLGSAINLSGGLTLAGGSSVAVSGNAPPGTAALISTSGGAANSGGASLAIGANSGDTATVNLTGTPYAGGSLSGTTFSYNLIDYTGTPLSATPSNNNQTLTFSGRTVLQLGTLPAGPYGNVQLVNNSSGQQIQLQYTAYAESWTGGTNGTWDTATQNWAFGSYPSSSSAQYVDTATVIFGDYNILYSPGAFSLGDQSITIQSGGVRPSSVTFNNSNSNYSFTNANNPATGVVDTVGIAGSTGLTLNGTASVTLNSPNSFSGAVQVNAGTLLLANPTPGNVTALGSSSGVSVAAGASLQLNSSNGAGNGNTYTFGNTSNGAGTIPLSIAGTGLASNPSGALNSVYGNNTYAGPIIVTAPATINSNSNTFGDQLTLAGSVNTGSNALTFTGVGNTNITGPISGNGGSVVYSGAGTLTLNGSGSYSGGTVINSGTVVAASGTALGTGSLSLAGGSLDFTQSDAIGVHVASDAANPATNPPPASYTVNSMTPSLTAGVAPIDNWNNLTIIRNSNGAQKIGSPTPPTGGNTPAGSTVAPLTLNDSSGAATSAQITSWSGGNTYSVTGSTNGNAQLLSSWLSTAGAPADITVSNIPYSNYSVYLYFYNNATAYGSANISTSTTSYYFSALTASPPAGTLTAATATTNPGATTGGYTSSDYAVWGGQSASSFTASVVESPISGNGEAGIAGIEIVNDTVSLTSNPVSVSSNSAIDVTGPSLVNLGTLSIGTSSQTTSLSITGGSSAAGIPYAVTTQAVTLGGNAVFNIANNKTGSGSGTLSLGAIGDGNQGYGITINGNNSSGTVVLTAGGSYGGPTVVQAGTLQVNGALTGTGAVSVAYGSTLAGPATTGGSASIAGAVTVNGTIAAANGAPLTLSGGLTLASGSSSAVALNGAPASSAIISTSGGNASSGGASLTIGGNSAIDLVGSVYGLPGTYTYNLFSYSGTPLISNGPSSGNSLSFTNAAGSLTLGGPLPSGPYTFSLVNNPNVLSGGAISLQVNAYGLTWSGATGGNWDTATYNWQYAPPSGTNSSTYVDGASVTFSDTNLNPTPTSSSSSGLATVNVQSAGVAPGAVAFNNSGFTNGGVDYFITGGSIGGATTIVSKSNTGTVTLNSANTYGGGTVISGGTVVAAQTASLGTGAVTLSGGTLRLGTSVVGINGTPGTSTSSAWTVNSNGITSAAFPAATSGVLQLTDGAVSEARSAFYNTPVPVGTGTSGFSTQFTYTPTAGSTGATLANGAAFILQNSSSGTSAIGGNGGGNGFSGITPSVGFQVNTYSSYVAGVTWQADGVTLPNSTGPQYTAPSGSGFSLAPGDPILVQLSYNPSDTTLSATFTNTVTNKTATYTNNTINVANVLGATTAYLGFSGATGADDSTQQISNFSYAVGGSYANNVVLTGGATSTIDLAASALNPNFSLGSLTVGSGGTSTLNVTASTAPANQSYSLTLGDVTVNSNTTFNVANVGSGTGTLNLGAISDGGAARTITFAGPGNVVSNGAPSLTGSGTSILVNAGTVQFNSKSAASIGTNVSATVATGATLQLVGAVSAFSDGTNPANVVAVNNNGTLSVTGASNQTVGVVSGTPSGGAGNPTVYLGSTVVGDGTNTANLTTTQILQNTLTINAGSTVTIAPSGSGIETEAQGSAAVSGVALAAGSSDSDSDSDLGSSTDPFTAIQAAIASGSISSAKGEQLENRIAAIERLATTDPGLDISLLENRVLAAIPSSSVWSAGGSSPADAIDSGLLAVSNDNVGSESSSLGTGATAAFAPSEAFGGIPVAVPEPSTLLLATLALAGVGLGLRRRQIVCER